MDRSALLLTLKEILEDDRGEPVEGLDEMASLREGLGLDSVDMLTMVMQIQDRFRVVLEADELERVVTVKDFLDMLQVKIANAPSSRAA